jgi:phosphoesterase RecJ-like protein
MTNPKAFKISEVSPLGPDLLREFEKALILIKSARRILISSTLTADGDSIGAQMGVLYFLRALGKKDSDVTIMNHTEVPERYRFLPEISKIQGFDPHRSRELETFDLGIVCDGGVERTGSVSSFFQGIKNCILIDHHVIGSQQEYSAKILDLNASSTCEIVYNLFDWAGVKVSPEIAQYLYLGIVFDTGFFKHSLTTPRTHQIAGELIRTGIDFSHLCDRALLERTWSAQRLLLKLLQNMELYADGRLLLSSWSQSELQEIHFKDGDQEGMINQLYFTQGVKVVALLTEMPDASVKVSFRSKGDFNVADLARTLDPGGGGHVRAAGCSLNNSLPEAKELIKTKIYSLIG